MGRRRRVRVPGSSANLGPGFDAMAAAVSVHLELEVEETGSFAVDPGDERLPADDSNLCVRAFSQLHPVEGLSFKVRSEIPLEAGLGSSGAAIVGRAGGGGPHVRAGAGARRADAARRRRRGASRQRGRVAVRQLRDLRERRGDRDRAAGRARGGRGRAARARADRRPRALRSRRRCRSPTRRSTSRARRRSRSASRAATSPRSRAGWRIGSTSRTAGTSIRARWSWSSARPSWARSGATISGAGPTVLFWVFFEQTGALVERLREEVEGWAEHPAAQLRRAGRGRRRALGIRASRRRSLLVSPQGHVRHGRR